MSAVVVMSKRTSNDAIIFRTLFKQNPQSRYIIEVSHLTADSPLNVVFTSMNTVSDSAVRL